MPDMQGAMDRALEKSFEICRGIATFQTVAIEEVKSVVERCANMLDDEPRVLSLIKPERPKDMQLAAHALNVTLLTLKQSQALGLQGDLYEASGIASFLHDVGILLMDEQYREKRGQMDEDEYVALLRHSFEGAIFLSQQPAIPSLALVAAYEHHMRFDGKGYPGVKRRDHGQHTISQIVAIADFYDTLRTDNPNRKALEGQVILGIMQKGSGTYFNPQLLQSFLTASFDELKSDE